jgi:hypothetical protein
MTTDKKININENQVIYKKVDGHKHDGLTSSLIDYKRYSIFDFTVYPVAPAGTSRRSFEDTNVKNLESFIISTVENRVLNPRGIAIQANTITAREIASGTITSGELASNIILVNNVIKSKNYNGTVNTEGNISARGNTGWAITHAGEAEFNNVFIRGNLIAGAGFYGESNTQIFANTGGFFSLGSNFTWTGSVLTIRGDLKFPDNTSPQSQNAVDGFIGGININSSEIQSNAFETGSAGFRISANGDAEFNDVIVRGNVQASTGFIGGWDISGSSLVNETSGTTQFIDIDAESGIFSRRYTGSFYGSGFYTDIHLNYGDMNNGIRVSGDGSGSYAETEIRSSFITTPDVVLNGTSLITRLAGKSGTSHTHAYASDTHTHAYIPTGGITQDSNIVFENTNTGTNASGQLFQLRRRLNNSVGPSGSSFGDNFIQFVRTAGNGWSEAVVSAIEFTSALGVGFNNVSDARMKENIVEISDALNIVNRIRPVNFSWKGYGDRREDGFIAQELYDVYPSSVSVGSDDISERPWGVYYGNFTPLLTAAIKELLAKVNSLEARIQVLEGV